MSENAYRSVLGAIFAAALAMGLVGIEWGLPNRDHTWAADAVAPMTPLSVAYHVFAEKGFDSGYFYFKYPVGHQLLLAAFEVPVIAVAYARGDLEKLSTSYPYGLRNADAYLAALSVTTRVVSLLAAAALLLVLGGIARRLGGSRVAGAFAALSGLASYPLVYYAHTSNVEVPFVFWAMLALYATIRAVEVGATGWYLVVGAAAAMAVSTKEQIAGFLLPLPALILLRHWSSDDATVRAPLPRGAIAGAAAAIVVFVGANAIFYNPSGFVHRLQFLTHSLDPALRELYAPYEFPIDFATHWTARDELHRLLETAAAVVTSIGWPAALAACAGLVLTFIGQPWAALYLLAPLAGYYVVSLRVLKLVEIRYVMPISTLLAVPAGFALATLWRAAGWRRIVAGAVVAFGLVWSGEVLGMLLADPRYPAEAWMAPRLAAGHTLEVYQSWTYLPRWSGENGVHKPEFDDITIEGLEARAPDYIAISSKGKEGMTMYPNPDWRDGRGMMLEREDNRRFVDALAAGRLGYHPVAAFEHPLLLDRELITSLNPAITIYQRDGVQAAGEGNPGPAAAGDKP